jgi:hypothetical protein
MYALRSPRPELDSLNHVARGPRRKSSTIGRSTQTIMEITGIKEIEDIVGIMSSNSQIRRRRDRSITLLTQRRGARSIIPQDMIWRSVKLYWTARRYHH